jgi:hypothetical protein
MPYFEPQWTSYWADAAFLHAAEWGDLASGLGRDDALAIPTMPYSRLWATRTIEPLRLSLGAQNAFNSPTFD